MRVSRMLAAASVLLALTAGQAVAQGRGHGRGRENAPGQLKKYDRQYDARFAPRDGDLTRNWYYHQRRERLELPPGFRDDDRLPRMMARRIGPGYVVEPDWRARLYPAPAALVRVFSPPPPGYRYMVLGGRVLLLDVGFRVSDAVGVELNLAY